MQQLTKEQEIALRLTKVNQEIQQLAALLAAPAKEKKPKKTEFLFAKKNQN